jgi:hypothetical protein
MTSFKEAYNKVDQYVEERYKIVSTIGDVIDPNTGDFDGSKIMVDYTLDAEQALFVLGHLFGHTVQWDTNEDFRKLGQETVKGATPEQLEKIFIYEQDATSYFIQLLHECNIYDLDQWATDFWYADWCALKAFYTEGTIIDQCKVRDNIRHNSFPVLRSLPIPEFTPTRYESRWSF